MSANASTKNNITSSGASSAAAEGLTEEQIADLKEAFAMFDINGDGKIDLYDVYRYYIIVERDAGSCHLRPPPPTHPPGTIELHELQQVMRKLGQNPTEDQLKEMIKSVDDNGDCEIDFDEFLLLMKSRIGTRDPEQELRDAFAVFDSDGSGAIDRKELKRLMKKLGQALSEAEIDAMMNEVDENGDGEISFEEFKALMQN
jgi:Ca2+-binding EF-hand superfamily protein